MRPRIFALRPEPGLSATIAAGADLGLQIYPMALSEVEPCSWDMPPLNGFDALLVGSANAFRHGGARLPELMSFPVFAVGAATAQEAELHGFKVAQTGEGGLQRLLDGIDTPTRFLRLAGEERISLAPPSHVEISEVVVYRVNDLAVPNSEVNQLKRRAIVLLHSASSAAHFARECDRLNLDRSVIDLAGLGPRILAAAGGGWAGLHAPETPNDAELLAMVRDIWQ